MAEIILEVVPPSRMTSEKHKEKVLNKITEAVNSINPDFINVPEVIDENFAGKPYYRNISARRFAKKIHELTGKKVVVNKVVAQCNGIKEFQEWITKSINELKITDFVFVGGNSSEFSYPGLSVIQANKYAKKIPGIKVGNIMIPSRKKEAERMMDKTISGADFFTSQILFESKKTKNILLEYGLLCKEKNITPSKVFLSFCPVSDINEFYFLKWLGVEIPPETEKEIFIEGKSIPLNSIQNAEKTWNEINAFAKEKNLSVQLGLNIEEIFFHNINYCVELASKIKET